MAFFDDHQNYNWEHLNKLMESTINSSDKELSEITKGIKEFQTTLWYFRNVISYLKLMQKSKGRKLKHYIKEAKDFTNALEKEVNDSMKDEKHAMHIHKHVFKLIEKAKKDVKELKRQYK